jgi:hypothetical protein
MRSTVLLSILVTCLVGPVVGCASEAGDAEPAGDVAEVNKPVLTDVGAFALEDGRIIAAPAKVAKLVGAIKKPKEGKLKCLPTATFTVLGRGGEKIGSLAMLCNPEEAESGTITAQLDVGAEGGATRSSIVDLDLRVVDAVRTAPLAVGDLVFGVDKLEMARGLGPAISTPSLANTARAIDALGPDQVPVAGAALKCLPDLVVTLKRGTKKVASVNVCGDEGTLDAPGAKVSGTIGKIDSADLKRLLEQLSQDDG